MTNIIHPIIDTHLHLFDLTQGDYAWLKPEHPPFWPDKGRINKRFTQADLVLDEPQQLHGFVHIEAGFDNQQPWREIDWLEQHCNLNFKSVGFADLTSPTFEQQLEYLMQRQSVVGIRHILDEQATTILAEPRTSKHFSLLEKHALSFDAQLSLTDSQAIDKLIALAKSYNALKIIINHAGWPLMAQTQAQQQAWQHNAQKLAKCDNIAIKLSGWEMANRSWQPHHAQQVIELTLNIFTDNKVMLASNFPLCLFSLSYADLWKRYAMLSNIDDGVYRKITYNNAVKWYKFNH